MKAALYVRTSTGDQTVDNQVRELEAVAERLGHEIVEVYADNGISGAKGPSPHSFGFGFHLRASRGRGV
jgi:DNA invertase Pin-like site-specific DNA recombinase